MPHVQNSVFRCGKSLRTKCLVRFNQILSLILFWYFFLSCCFVLFLPSKVDD